MGQSFIRAIEENNPSNFEKYFEEEVEEAKNPKKCKDCKVNDISKKFINSSICLCEKCYEKRKRKMYEQDIQFKGIVQISEITPKIFLGNNEGAKSKELLKSKGITHVLVVGFYLHEYFPDDFVYKTIEIEDNETEKIIDFILPAIDFIEQAEKVYVHCRAGVSRSSTIVIGYIMWKNKMNYEEARKFVEEKREVIEPNENFVLQLREFDDILKVCGYDYKLIKEFFKSFIKNHS